LVTPQTSKARIHTIDKLTDAFVYIVSSNAITGGNAAIEDKQQKYFSCIKNMKLQNPTMIGFGIRDKATFDNACNFANGAIIGTAFIKAIDRSEQLQEDIKGFIQSIKTGEQNR
jgi:tryptophan synthase alpha chain